MLLDFRYNRWQWCALYDCLTSQEIEFQSKDEFFILACDGLWDVLDSQDAIDIVSESFEKGLSAQVCLARHFRC